MPSPWQGLPAPWDAHAISSGSLRTTGGRFYSPFTKRLSLSPQSFHNRINDEVLYRYISGNEEQMRYNISFKGIWYRLLCNRGGACKHVVGKGLKQSGMIWDMDSRRFSSATSALRIAWLNNECGQLITKSHGSLKSTCKCEVHPAQSIQ
jgi:hypothetical protein